MTPVITLTDGRWVASTRWMPTARAIWAILTIDSSTSLPATIIRSLSSSTSTTMYGKRSNCSLIEGARIELLSVAGDVASPGICDQVVAAVHLGHRPLEGVVGLLGIGDDPSEQVGHTVVLTQLDSLGIDHDQRTSSGVARIRIEVTNELMPTTYRHRWHRR